MLIAKAICDKLSDQEIINKALEEVSYFSCLYERYEERLLRYIRRLSSVSEEEAEDILQDAFIKIWKNLRAYDHRLPLSSWLYRIVHNQAISHWRKSRSFGKKNRISWRDARLEDVPESDVLFSWEETDSTPEMIQRVLTQLPLPYREVLVLRFYERLSYEEISDVLKIPEGTVATRLNRAKRAFAKLANQQYIHFA